MSTDVSGPVRARISRPARIALALSAVLFACGVALGLPFVDRDAYLPSPEVPWWVLAVAFAATEIYVVHLQSRRQGQTISLSEIPLVVGLFLASPVALLVGKLVGSVVAMVAHRRSPALKITFNLALHFAETSVAVAVFRTLTHLLGGAQPITWLAACVAAFAASCLSHTAVALIVAIHEGGLTVRAVLRAAVTCQGASPMAVTLALIGVITVSASSGPMSVWIT